MRVYYGIILLCLFSILIRPLWAYDDFLCQCKATGPGYEETNRATGGIDKICSYKCLCLAWDVKINPATGMYLPSIPVANLRIDVDKKATTAYSRESWDQGSHICHGQYSYRPNLSDDAWKIQVRFDQFQINSKGEVSYDEEATREISQGINHKGFKYTKKAPEISEELKKKLKTR